jgi:hypothetical protein
MNAVVPISAYRRTAPYLNFTRAELHRLLNLYSSRVMRGEWRDYAISHGPTTASFFIFRHSNEYPLFVISKLETRGKDRVAAAKNGRYVLFNRHRKLKQAHELDDVLHLLSQPLTLLGT